MIPSGTRIWLAAGITDMRRGFDGQAAIVQEKFAADPFSSHRPADDCCPDCGGVLKTLGEDVAEALEYVPASFRV